MGSHGKEYEFLISQAKRLKERNEKKQKWIDIDSCDSTPEFDECDLEDQKVAKSVQRWMGDFFRRYQKAKRAKKGVYKEMKRFDKLLMKSSRLDHEIKDKFERCKEVLYEVKSISSKNFLSRSARSPCPGLPELNMKGRWNGSDGKEYNFLKSYHESGNLKQRNEKKQNWINNIDTCKSPPNSINCDLEGEELVKSVQRWLKYFFNSNQRAELVRKEVNDIVNEVGNLLLESSKLDHRMKEAWEEKKERCDQKFNVENDNNNIEATTTIPTTTEPNLNGGSYTFNANSMLLLISMIVLHALNKF